ncbi:hypothetical protein [Deinococcus planocerae]|uniref:hypothetical protein n=1 Tax=Deinococcus planocerae TaxID=1737569 RepID=UPI000C7E9BE1|nr:hypothetical protein [Deinococcus planocerae]
MTTLPQSTFVARTPEQARVLLDLAYAPTLNVLMTREASAGEVARETKSPVKRAHHLLTRLLGAGLIEVTGERKRGGRPVKLYRAARSYEVPFALTDAATLEELVAALHRPFLEAYFRARARPLDGEPQDSVFIGLNEDEGLVLSLRRGAREDPGRLDFGSLSAIRLPHDAMRELRRRMQELQGWVSQQARGAQDGPQTAACLVGLLFTPGEIEGL